jgi:S1-C subfamily serine protease
VKTTTLLKIPAALCALALLTPSGAALAQGTPPPPAAPQPPAAVQPNAKDLDAQLEAARRKLEVAAHEFAELSAQMSRPYIDKFFTTFGAGPGSAVLGLQLDGAAPGGGARVREVSPGGPAAEAGVRAGDVIVAVNGKSLTADEPAHQVVELMHDVKPDSKVSVRVLRDGKPQEFSLTTRASPEMFATAHGLPDMNVALPALRGDFMFRRPLMDMELATLTPRLGSYFGTDKGVLVVRAPASDALKLEDGDVILTIDGRQPTSGSHATRILGSYQPGEKVTLRVLRDHKTLQYETTLPNQAAPMHLHKELRRDSAPPIAPTIQPRKVVLFGDNLA